jgi:hypothetical protein
VIAFLIVLAAVILIEAAVLRFGVDSRDGKDWRRDCC